MPYLTEVSFRRHHNSTQPPGTTPRSQPCGGGEATSPLHWRETQDTFLSQQSMAFHQWSPATNSRPHAAPHDRCLNSRSRCRPARPPRYPQTITLPGGPTSGGAEGHARDGAWQPFPRRGGRSALNRECQGRDRTQSRNGRAWNGPRFTVIASARTQPTCRATLLLPLLCLLCFLWRSYPSGDSRRQQTWTWWLVLLGHKRHKKHQGVTAARRRQV